MLAAGCMIRWAQPTEATKLIGIDILEYILHTLLIYRYIDIYI